MSDKKSEDDSRISAASGYCTLRQAIAHLITLNPVLPVPISDEIAPGLPFNSCKCYWQVIRQPLSPSHLYLSQRSLTSTSVPFSSPSHSTIKTHSLISLTPTNPSILFLETPRHRRGTRNWYFTEGESSSFSGHIIHAAL